MIKKYTNGAWEESGYEKMETVDSVGGYRMGFNGSGEPLDDYTIKGGVFQTKNLCTLMLEGVFINTTNGSETTGASYESSQFIPVDFDNIPEYVITAQTLSGCHISGYDATRKYCGRTDVNRPIGTIIKSNSFTYGTPASTEPVKYIRVCCNKSSVDVKFSEAITPNNVVPVQGTGDEVKITLSEPLRAIGDYKDTLDLSTGVVTRYIKKLVLTGEENWTGYANDIYRLNLGQVDSSIGFGVIMVMSNYYAEYGTESWSAHGRIPDRSVCLKTEASDLFIKDHRFLEDDTLNLTAFKTYLTQQYTNGTPVTIWYVLVTPTTETVSVPSGMTGIIEGTVTQEGTPTPDNPIEPVFKGDLQPDGTYSVYSTYKITIASGEQSILLDEPLRAVGNYKDTIDLATKTFTKRIQELVLTGEEYIGQYVSGDSAFRLSDPSIYSGTSDYRTLSNNYQGIASLTIAEIRALTDYVIVGRTTYSQIFIVDTRFTTVADFKSYLTQQYANGTPVRVWYVLAEPIVSTLDSIPDGLTGTIEGTVYQSGTPTPNNPIEPVFNGELQYNSGKYKIIVSPNNTFSDIYLGQVPTTRRIKKLVLTGEENWSKYVYANQYAFVAPINALASETTILLNISNYYNGIPCNGFGYVGGAPNKSTFIRITYGNILLIMDMDFAEVSDFKSFLSIQYAAGTPVTVWYVLAEPEVGIFNEPLMQIGEYADSITYEQANVPIPTSKGDTSLVVATHVPPSEVTISSSGWHLHKNAKKYHNSKWEATSWEGFRDMVIDGTAPQVYPVGTILYDDWGNTNSTGFQIVGYDVDEYMDPDMTAQGYTHNCVLLEEKLNYNMMYDMSGAWLYLEKPLPAGSYRFGYGDKIWIFTSTANVPEFGQLAMTRTNDTTPKNIQGYGFVGSETALFDVIATEWDESTPCVDLGKVVNSTTDSDISPYGKLNHQLCVIGGSNTYYSSMVRQWLIAESPKGQWWTPMTIFSRPYTSYTTNTDGCLYRLNTHFKNVLATPAITYYTNTLFVSTSVNGENLECGTSYIVRDKLFLLHQYNVSGNKDSILEYYINADDTKRQKYNASGNVGYWRLRDALSRASNYNTISVYPAGFVGGRVCNAGFGCPAACVIQGYPASHNTVYTTLDGEVYTTSDGKPYKVYQD